MSATRSPERAGDTVLRETPCSGRHVRGETPMICVECRQRHHDACPGGSWCDCQHQPSPTAQQTQETQETQGEPALSWVRQG